MQIKIHITGKRLRNRLCYCPSSTFRQVKSIELNATNGLADVNENELSLNCFKLHLQVVFPSESHEFVINNSNTLHGICIQQNTLAREHIHSGASKRFTISFEIAFIHLNCLNDIYFLWLNEICHPDPFSQGYQMLFRDLF